MSEKALKTLDQVIELNRGILRFANLPEDDVTSTAGMSQYYLKQYRDRINMLEAERLRYMEAVRNCEIAENSYRKVAAGWQYKAGITGSEYQKAAMRTNDGKNWERLDTLLDYEKVDVGGILDGCLGLAGESGEFIDLVKKWIFHERELDEGHAKKELGDVCWYIAMIAYSFGWDLDEILKLNIDKLKARYPEGFDTGLSNHRAEGDV